MFRTVLLVYAKLVMFVARTCGFLLDLVPSASDIAIFLEEFVVEQSKFRQIYELFHPGLTSQTVDLLLRNGIFTLPFLGSMETAMFPMGSNNALMKNCLVFISNDLLNGVRVCANDIADPERMVFVEQVYDPTASQHCGICMNIVVYNYEQFQMKITNSGCDLLDALNMFQGMYRLTWSEG